MTSAGEQVERCDLCGTPLFVSSGAPGCLNCLLAGGRDGAEQRHYQHYEVTVGEDGVTPAELGRGAMGITYRALDLNLGAPVALKVISARYSNQDEARDRFRREARTAAQLRHPNVASVYHFGETAAGQCFYAMELVEGETLEARVGREGPLGAEVVLEIATQVARALLAAEKHGLVHRDLKPSNLMLVPNESGNEQAPGVKVIDFGLARAVTGEVEAQNMTHTGFAGTPGFASPEQFQTSGNRLDTRSDIYSLGVTLWYALTEEIPPPGDSLPVERMVARKVPGPMIRLLRHALATDPAERPQSARAFLAELELCQAAIEAAPRRRQRLRRVALVMGFFVICGAGLTSYLLQRHRAVVPMPPAKSIAVLPFANLSADQENSFFAEGVQDDILTALAKIADLKVIARASVMNYGAGPDRDLREIGQALGVAKVLEGSVRRAGDKVRVTAQLIDTRTNTQLWAESYDRDVADVFAIQSEIAKEITNQLQAKLSPREKAAIEKPPTTDLAAFDLYTRAKSVTLTANFSALGEDELLLAVDLLNQAVARDPTFFLAWCQLATVHDQLYFLGIDHTPARLALGNAAVEKALRLQPDSGEAHLALAQHFYRGYQNYDHAKAELAIAQRTLPNDPQIFELAGYIDRREGHWEESTRNLRRALDLDPRNFFTLQQIALSYEMLRGYAEMAAVLDQALAIVPKDVETRVARALVDLDWHADPRPLHTTIEAILAEDPAAAPTFADNWLNLALCERDPAAAGRACAALADGGVQISALKLSRAFWEGMVARVRGDAATTRAAFIRARAEQEAVVRAEPDYAPALCVLGLIDAALGRKDDALREGRRAAELLPVARDSINGAHMIEFFALICAWTGEKDLALQQLAIATQNPGTLSYGQLRLHPFWDPLRGDPRFERLVANLAPESALPLTTRRDLFWRDGTQNPANIQGGSPLAISGKSVAVLPFDNLSSDPENAFFADGIQDDILTSLTRISELKVISRTSVKQYRGPGASRNLREISRALDVANVLEGSVRRVDNRVLVSVQLIDANNDRHIWAERYDRTIADSLGLQGELATEIAKALKAKLAPEEKVSLGTKPTSNPEAYVVYLRALDFEQNSEVPVAEYYATLDQLYAQAIALDPTFALARARASISFSIQFFQTHDPALKTKARTLAEEALRLSPALGEAHLALGLYFDLIELDYSAALEQFTIALTALPNNVEALTYTARIYRRHGRWREAISGFVQARSLDPDRNPFDMVQTYWMVRDWRNAAAEMKRNLAKNTGSPFLKIALSQIEVVANFDLAAARAKLQEIPAGVDPDGVVTLANWNQGMLERDWAAAEKWLAGFPPDEFPDVGPKSYYQAQTALARGDVERARTLFEKVRPALEKDVRDHPGAPGDHAALGILYAYMGRKEEALRESRRAVELCPESTDALNGVLRACDLALVYALTGEVDQGVTLIERLLRTPGATTRQEFANGGITQAELRLRWQWDKLRGDRRFQKLVDGPEPKTIY